MLPAVAAYAPTKVHSLSANDDFMRLLPYFCSEDPIEREHRGFVRGDHDTLAAHNLVFPSSTLPLVGAVFRRQNNSEDMHVMLQALD